MSSEKYPRTMHLPFSPGKGVDDKIAKDISSLLMRPILITEKCDGSNTSLEKDGCFARTHSGPPTHLSFDGLKALHASVKSKISKDMQIFGEWVYAVHSIKYEQLPGYFLAFAIRDGDTWLSWEDVELWASEIEVPTVPVLWMGEVKTEKELKYIITELATQPSACGGAREGVVIRIQDSFDDKNFSKYVMKFVRKNHVQTNKHWKDQEIVRNNLK